MGGEGGFGAGAAFVTARRAQGSPAIATKPETTNDHLRRVLRVSVRKRISKFARHETAQALIGRVPQFVEHSYPSPGHVKLRIEGGVAGLAVKWRAWRWG